MEDKLNLLELSEEQLIELIKIHTGDKYLDKEIELTERCLTNDGGLKLFFNAKEVSADSSHD